MGKRFSESANKKAEGNYRKREKAREKLKAENERAEIEEAAKWEAGSKKVSSKKEMEEQKKEEKLRAKAERAALLAEEEAALGKGGKGKFRK